MTNLSTAVLLCNSPALGVFALLGLVRAACMQGGIHLTVPHDLQASREPPGTLLAPPTVFRSLPQLARDPGGLAAGSWSARRVQLQPAPTEDPAKRLDQAVRAALCSCCLRLLMPVPLSRLPKLCGQLRTTPGSLLPLGHVVLPRR